MDTPQWPWQQNPSGEPELPACWLDHRRHDHMVITASPAIEIVDGAYREVDGFRENNFLCGECGMWVPNDV